MKKQRIDIIIIARRKTVRTIFSATLVIVMLNLNRQTSNITAREQAILISPDLYDLASKFSSKRLK